MRENVDQKKSEYGHFLRSGKFSVDYHFCEIFSVFAQKRIQNPVKHLRWSFLGKHFIAFRRELLSQKASP